MELTADQLRQLAREAYGHGVAAPTEEQRGFYAGVEGLARFLTTGEVDGRLDRLLSWASHKATMPL
jgi:hypothetical protein